MKIKRGLLCLAVWILAAALVFSMGAAYADEHLTEEADAAEEKVDSDEGEGEKTVPAFSSEQSGGAESSEEPVPALSDNPSSDTESTEPPESDPATDGADVTSETVPQTTEKPLQTTPPITTAPPVTSAPITTQPITTEPETTAADTKSTEVLILTGIPQVSGYYPLSTDYSVTPPDGSTQVTPQPSESDAEISENSQVSGEGDSFTSVQTGSASTVASAEQENDQPQSSSGHVLVLALFFGGACAAGAALLIILKAKNIQ